MPRAERNILICAGGSDKDSETAISKREGKVLAVLGSSLDDTVDTDVVICRHQLPVEFSEETYAKRIHSATKAAQTDPNRRD
jgi:exoribonuclease R